MSQCMCFLVTSCDVSRSSSNLDYTILDLKNWEKTLEQVRRRLFALLMRAGGFREVKQPRQRQSEPVRDWALSQNLGLPPSSQGSLDNSPPKIQRHVFTALESQIWAIGQNYISPGCKILGIWQTSLKGAVLPQTKSPFRNTVFHTKEYLVRNRGY